MVSRNSQRTKKELREGSSSRKARLGKKDDVARATGRVVAASGLEGTTLRAIAREAGCTTGVLMHYFRDKEELLLFVLARMFERAEIELVDALAQQDPLQGLKNVFLDFLPLTKESEMEARSWLNFVGRALWNRAFLREWRVRYVRFRALIEQAIRTAQQAGIIHADIHVDKEADALLAFFEGIGLHALLEPGRFPPQRQIALADYYIERLTASDPNIHLKATRRTHATGNGKHRASSPPTLH